MPSRFRLSAHDYELLPRASFESQDFPELETTVSNSSWLGRLADSFPLGTKQLSFSNPSVYAHFITPRRKRRSFFRLVYWSLFLFPYVCLFLVLFVAICFPSYTHRPAHYEELRQNALNSTTPGRANANGEKVFIASSLYETNGTLTGGIWGESVLQLIDLLGPENVYLSIYENNADPLSVQALENLKLRAPCNSTITSSPLPLSSLPHLTLPYTNETYTKRITYLSEVRNRALAPLQTLPQRFDRILYLNDIYFNPIEAAQLLFSTNVDPKTGRANYGAACAVDFINAFKFYDRFATRDAEGFNMGIPFFPWFTNGGDAVSRRDVLAGSDAVRVKSCWGGMVAYEAKWFQGEYQEPVVEPQSDEEDAAMGTAHNSLNATRSAAKSTSELLESYAPSATSWKPQVPLKFRSSTAIYWDSSECCLVNADLAYLRSRSRSRGSLEVAQAGNIVMNPFIRVAYSPSTLPWLQITRRPERLYSLIHAILNRFVGFPQYNERQFEYPGDEMTDIVWEGPWGNSTIDGENGYWREEKRIAEPGGFCGGRNLLVMREDEEGFARGWFKILVPRPPPTVKPRKSS